ncbi:MAG TPA: hypothetical protein VFY59_03340 [Rubrobacter sp.]|jgi:hypothetical protein|nr:hypothetical protein [Rubrobacter sp.]
MGIGQIPIIEGAFRLVEDRLALRRLRDEAPKPDAGASRNELWAEATIWA